MENKRLTIDQEGVHEIDKIKGSRFIAYAFAVSNIENMSQKVEALWNRYPDARHICWAYRGGDPDQIRMVDDGEPSGTAGKPILTVIEGRGLESVGVAVVRYFGGTKLGTGGLARAYSQATQEILNLVGERVLQLCCRIDFQVHYSFESTLSYLLEQIDAEIREKQYTQEVKMSAVILTEQAERLCEAVTERTSGKAVISKFEDYWA